ncbi:hypothetical protein GH714_016414 [Hevea brasiliensis]|uniref:Uncharacterized protein n=1 Tax=Hevea brasiliensis TaxID=3981 RepID=A0A6A6K6L9_HEVBR|nr:hypothetical protein GH714_016414 [Hevea brasiliensis]
MVVKGAPEAGGVAGSRCDALGHGGRVTSPKPGEAHQEYCILDLIVTYWFCLCITPKVRLSVLDDICCYLRFIQLKNIGMIDTIVSNYQRMIDSLQAIEKEGAFVESLKARRQVILDNIRDNDEAGINDKKEIEENEKHRCQLQDMIEKAISKDGSKTYLWILSQYRLLGMANTELQFEMAKRMMPHLGISDKKQSSVCACGRYGPMGCSQSTGHSFSRSCIFQHYQDFGSRSFSRRPWDPGSTFCREEHHSSFYMLSHYQCPPAYLRLRKSSDHWVGGMPESCFGISINPQNLRTSCPEFRTWASPCSEGFPSASYLSADFSHQHKIYVLICVTLLKQEKWNNSSRQHLNESPNAGKSASQTMMGHGGTNRGFLAQFLGLRSSNHIFQHTEPFSGPNI